MYYRGESQSADQTEESFPYLEFIKRPDRHHLTYDGRESKIGDGTVWFNRSQVTGREQSRFFLEKSWIFTLVGKSGIFQGMRFETGDLLCLPPKVEFESDFNAGPELNVSLHHNTLKALASNSLPRIPSILRKSEVQPAIAGINRFIDSGEGDPLSLCLSMLPGKPEQLTTPARRRLASQIRDLLDAHLDEICIADVCRRLGVSVRGAEIAFRAEFGVTMRQYVTRNRLERARCLLLQGWSVSHAAQEVGWVHLGRFSAAFKMQFGVSPSRLGRPDRHSHC